MPYRICNVDECDKRVVCKGYCQQHYDRLRRYGNAHHECSRKRAHGLTLREAFDTFELIPIGDCLVWPGALNKKGYPSLRYEGKSRSAHRVAYELRNGPTDLQIDHLCRNRACVNAEHLRPVTNKQNQENKSQSGAGLSGVRGVTRDHGKWRVQVMHNGRNHSFGTFVDLAEAKAAAVDARNKLFTHNEADRV